MLHKRLAGSQYLANTKQVYECVPPLLAILGRVQQPEQPTNQPTNQPASQQTNQHSTTSDIATMTRLSGQGNKNCTPKSTALIHSMHLAVGKCCARRTHHFYAIEMFSRNLYSLDKNILTIHEILCYGFALYLNLNFYLYKFSV